MVFCTGFAAHLLIFVQPVDQDVYVEVFDIKHAQQALKALQCNTVDLLVLNHAIEVEPPREIVDAYGNFTLLDCQFMTDHLRSMGAMELAQADYRRLVERAQGQPPASLGMAWRAFNEGYAPGAGVGAGVAAGVADGRAAGLPDASGDGAAGPSSPGKRIVQSLTQTS